MVHWLTAATVGSISTGIAPIGAVVGEWVGASAGLGLVLSV